MVPRVQSVGAKQIKYSNEFTRNDFDACCATACPGRTYSSEATRRLRRRGTNRSRRGAKKGGRVDEKIAAVFSKEISDRGRRWANRYTLRSSCIGLASFALTISLPGEFSRRICPYEARDARQMLQMSIVRGRKGAQGASVRRPESRCTRNKTIATTNST